MLEILSLCQVFLLIPYVATPEVLFMEQCDQSYRDNIQQEGTQEKNERKCQECIIFCNCRLQYVPQEVYEVGETKDRVDD